MNKVVLLAPTPPPASGIASWTVRILKCGLGCDWEPVVVDEKVIGKRGVFANTRRNVFEETKRTLKIWKNLIVALKDPDVKVVQSCIPPTTFAMMREYVCSLITRFFKRKYIIHYRSTLPNFVVSGINEHWYKKLSKFADLSFVLNGPSAQMIEKTVGNKYRLIPNFIENDAIKQTHKINDCLKTLLYVGGVTPEKGCDVIIEAAKFLPDITFRLVGAVSESIGESDLPENVVLVGEKNKEEVNSELEAADCFLFLSRYIGEGFSNALVEAMAAGLPCIVTDWAANADMVINDECGVVLDKATPDKLVEAVKNISDCNIRKNMSENCIKRVKECYSQDCVIGQYVDAYNFLTKG